MVRERQDDGSTQDGPAGRRLDGERTPRRYGLPADADETLAAVGWLEAGRIVEAAAPLFEELRAGPDPDGAWTRLRSVIDADPSVPRTLVDHPTVGRGLVRLLGASRALGRLVATHPSWIADPDGPPPLPPPDCAGDEDKPCVDALHVFLARTLIWIATRDLLGYDDMPQVGRRLSDMVDTALRIALGHAVRHRGATDGPRLTIVAMGKWGARELNYSSDVDLLFVCDRDPERASAIAQEVLALFSQPPRLGVGLRLDARLRPEGAAGPLARTLEGFTRYWERWAATWEFQALLKARPAAGDVPLGERFLAEAEPHVYPDVLDPEAVDRVREMRSRVADQADDGELKRGVGGIRDVEFAVQLLQLVHGRSDPTLRVRGTLSALAALATGGYVRPEDAEDLAEAYRWLRTLEHRIQLWELRQTHTLPEDPTARERLAKAMGYRDDAGTSALETFEADLVDRRRRVRTIHERLFYRPLLEAFAASPTIRLTPEGTRRQLRALGFTDFEGAERAVKDLTRGLSRRSQLMRQLLPLMLDWLSETPDPDLGLRQLRTLVAEAGDHAALIAALRDNPIAAARLCRILGTSRAVGRLMDRIPGFVQELGDDDRLERRPSRTSLIDDAVESVLFRPDDARRTEAVRRFARHGILRVAARDLLGLSKVPGVCAELTDIADAATAGALATAEAAVAVDPRFAELPDVPFTVVAMGRWGAEELHYPSDLDLLFVTGTVAETTPTSDGDARDYADRIARAILAILRHVTDTGPVFAPDPDLRPEGAQGPLVRTLDAYRRYWERWARPWERLALIRARPAIGDDALGSAFTDAAASFVWRPLSDEDLRSLRHVKARAERERLPHGTDPSFHLKLGPGALFDVEFAVGLRQLEIGADEPSVRTRGVLRSVAALAEVGALTPDEADALSTSWRLCTTVRNRLFLLTGRPQDALPAEPETVDRLARSLGYRRDPSASLREDLRRATRRARAVTARIVFPGGEVR